MYNRKTGLVVVEIPKCGSRTLVATGNQYHGKKVWAHHGHKTLSELLPLLPEIPPGGEKHKAVAVIRNPLERALSQINSYMKTKQVSLKVAVDCMRSQGHIMFKPQAAFLDDDEHFDTKLVRMEEIHEAREMIAGKYIISDLKLNKSPDLVSMSELEEKICPIEICRDLYLDDFKLFLLNGDWKGVE